MEFTANVVQGMNMVAVHVDQPKSQLPTRSQVYPLKQLSGRSIVVPMVTRLPFESHMAIFAPRGMFFCSRMPTTGGQEERRACDSSIANAG